MISQTSESQGIRDQYWRKPPRFLDISAARYAGEPCCPCRRWNWYILVRRADLKSIHHLLTEACRINLRIALLQIAVAPSFHFRLWSAPSFHTNLWFSVSSFRFCIQAVEIAFAATLLLSSFSSHPTSICTIFISFTSLPIFIITQLIFDFCNNAFTNKFFSNPIQYLSTDYQINNHIPPNKQIRLYLSLLLPLLRSSVSRAFLSLLPYIYFLCGCCALCNNRHCILYIA